MTPHRSSKAATPMSHTQAAAARAAREEATTKRKKGRSGKAMSAQRARASTVAANGTGTPIRSAMLLDLKLHTKEDRDRLFRKMDDNNSGSLTYNETEEGMRREYMQLNTLINAKRNGNQILKRAYKAADKALKGEKSDGLVTRHEFRLFTEYIEFFANLWDAFEEVDKNGDGKLNCREFQDGFVLIEPETTLTPEELEMEFNYVDADKGGVITFDEFCAWMARRKREDAPKIHARQTKKIHDLELVLSCTGLEFFGGDLGSLDTQAVVSEVKRVANPRGMKDKNGAPMVSVRDVSYEVVGWAHSQSAADFDFWGVF